MVMDAKPRKRQNVCAGKDRHQVRVECSDPLSYILKRLFPLRVLKPGLKKVNRFSDGGKLETSILTGSNSNGSGGRRENGWEKILCWRYASIGLCEEM